MIRDENFIVIGGTGHHELDARIIDWVNDAAKTNLRFNHINFDKFNDDEPDFRIQNYEKLKDKIVIVIQSVNTPELQEQILTLAWAAKYQYKAKHVIAVFPFIRFRRQENKNKMCEIDRNLMLMHDIKSKGIDQVIFCDIHSEITLKNCEDEGLTAYNVSTAETFSKYVISEVDDAKNNDRKAFVYSPDEGSIPRALSMAKILDISVLVDLKDRQHDGKVESVDAKSSLEDLQKKYDAPLLPADKEHVNGATIIMTEDELSTAGTAKKTGQKLRKDGAKTLSFIATHPVCSRGWKRKIIDNQVFDFIYLGNTIHRGYEKSTGGAVTEVSVHVPIAQKLLSVMQQAEKKYY